MMKKGSLFILIMLVMGMLITGCMSYTTEKPSLTTKAIQVKAVYPRSDTYQNHFPPYIVTTSGEIYDVDSDLMWAKFNVGENYTIRYSRTLSIGSNSRDRTGTIKDISEAKYD